MIEEKERGAAKARQKGKVAGRLGKRYVGTDAFRCGNIHCASPSMKSISSSVINIMIFW
jgi:hypothetical protein